MNRLTHHVRSNAIAYLALFVALGGTSYAALEIPANSVGGRQIRNHVINPVKLNPKYIAGSVRAWASVNAKGKIVASSGGASIVASVGADRDHVDPRNRSAALLAQLSRSATQLAQAVVPIRPSLTHRIPVESGARLVALVTVYVVRAVGTPSAVSLTSWRSPARFRTEMTVRHQLHVSS